MNTKEKEIKQFMNQAVPINAGEEIIKRCVIEMTKDGKIQIMNRDFNNLELIGLREILKNYAFSNMRGYNKDK